MSWTTPRVWTVAAVSTAHMNEVSEQLAVLHKGNGHTSLTSISPSASGLLTIGSVDQAFSVTDPLTVGIRHITTTGREPGNCIHLLMAGSGSVYTNWASPPAGSSPVIINHEQTPGSYNLYQYQLLTLVFNGSFWLCNYVIN